MLNYTLNEDKDTAVGLIIKEPSVSYKTKEYRHPLFSEIRAIRGKCDNYRAEKIAERTHLPLEWLDQAPSMNGEKGTEKLRHEGVVFVFLFAMH